MCRTVKGAQSPRLADVGCFGASSYLPDGTILPYVVFDAASIRGDIDDRN